MKEQALALYENLPKYVEGLTAKFPPLAEYIGTNGDHMKIDPQHLKEFAPNVAKHTLNLTAGLLGALANAVLVLFLTSYFVVEAKEMWAKLLLWIPPQHRLRASGLIKPLGARMGGYVRGQLLVSIAVATFSGHRADYLESRVFARLGRSGWAFQSCTFCRLSHNDGIVPGDSLQSVR